MLTKALVFQAIVALLNLVIASPISSNSDQAVHNRRRSQDVGFAIIINQCDFDVYYDNVPQQGLGYDSTGCITPGGNYSVQYDAPQIGHSIKLSLIENDTSDILQFEYSQTMNGYVDYDVSSVNGEPFDQWGFSLDADSDCPSILCEVPVDGCEPVYHQPMGDMNPNFYCYLSGNIGLTLCNS